MTNSNQDKVDKAYNLADVLKRTKTVKGISEVSMGCVLYELKQKNTYKKAFGPDIDTWEKFLAQPEIALTPTEARRLMSIVEFFVVKNNKNTDDLQGIPTRVLKFIADKFKGEELEEELLNEIIQSAKTLSYRDLKERLHDIKTEDDSGPRTYSYMIMRRCNETQNLSRVKSISNEDIKKIFPNIDESH